MKRFIKLFSMLLAILMLCGCGGNGQETEPTDTKTAYPEPDKVIALTFDDGPDVDMNDILDVFAEYGGNATFFLIGKKIDEETGEYVKRAYNEGHEIGNHSFSHEKMTLKSQDEIVSEVSKVQEKVKELIGVEPVWYRPPFLAANSLTYMLIDMPHAHCSVSAGDGTNQGTVEERIHNVTGTAHDGAIALLHCEPLTVQALPEILHKLKMQGYEFVTISELFERVGHTPVGAPGFMYHKNTDTPK